MSETAAADPASIRPGFRNGSLIFLVVVAAIVALVVLGGALGLQSLFAAFLFAWYWANVEAMRFDRLPAAILGGLVGVALAASLHYLPQHLGPNGGIVGLVLILAAVFVQIQNWLPQWCNASTMLFLTVMAAPAVLAEARFGDAALCVLLGAGFFAAIVWLAQAAAARMAPPSA